MACHTDSKFIVENIANLCYSLLFYVLFTYLKLTFHLQSPFSP